MLIGEIFNDLKLLEIFLSKIMLRKSFGLAQGYLWLMIVVSDNKIRFNCTDGRGFISLRYGAALLLLLYMISHFEFVGRGCEVCILVLPHEGRIFQDFLIFL